MGENGDIARRGLDVFLRRSYEEAQRLCAEDVELWTLFDQPGAEPEFSGHRGLRLWFRRLSELWAFVEVQRVEVDERNGGWVLMRVAARVRGRGSPQEFEPRITVAMQLSDGKISKFGIFPAEDDAVAMIAAG